MSIEAAEPIARKPALSPARALNISFRTAHLGVAGVLVGGHVFDVARERLLIWLYLTIATGLVMVVLESWPTWRWWHEGRGAMTLAKLLLLALIPWFWPYRVWLLAAVVVLASVGSHLPARFRYYSLLYRCMPGEPHGFDLPRKPPNA